MRIPLLAVLLITACFIEDEASISHQSAGIEGGNLTDPSDPAYIEEGECLISINGELTLGKETILEKLTPPSCLPSGKLSWLFKVKKEREISIEVAKPLRLAILFDTSESLRHSDPEGKRYVALKEYLENVQRKVDGKEIESAEIAVYPFKYCNQSVFELNITSSGSFSKDLDSFIGTDYRHEGSIKIIDKGHLTTLTAYGAVGSTNYLQSLQLAVDFLDKGEDNTLLQHMLIITDGLPFTYDDRTTNTVDLNGDGCDKNLSSINTNQIDKNVYEEFFSKKYSCLVKENILYPSKVDCITPKTLNREPPPGFTINNAAWDDPLNHVLGMAQHIKAIDLLRKDNDIKVYAVYLKCPDDKEKKCMPDGINQHLVEFFLSKITDVHDVADNAADLTSSLKKILETQVKSLTYKKTGEAYLSNGGEGNGTPVDKSTKLHGYRIKVGRDAENDKVFDYDKDASGSQQGTLIVEHGLEGVNGNGSFSIGYDFEFKDTYRADSPIAVNVSGDNSIILELNKYEEEKYTAYCLLPPRCDDSKECCDNPDNPYRVVTDEECHDKGQSWKKFPTCMCGAVAQESVGGTNEDGELVVDTPPSPTPSGQPTGGAPRPPAGGGGKPTYEPPPPPAGDGKPVSPPPRRSTEQSPNQNPPVVVSPPSHDGDTGTVEGERPGKGGKGMGEGRRTVPSQGTVWGRYEQF